MRIKDFLLIILFTLGILESFGQSILSIDDFFSQLSKNHPIAKQADARVSQSIADILSNRGAFDPTLAFSNSQKTWNGKDYFNYQNPEIKVKTPLGVSIKTGIESSAGVFTNPEATLGTVSYIGAEVSLLKGLLIDRQRADLRQSEIFRSQSEEEKRATINDLYLDASYAYWQWAGNKQILDVFQENLNNAEARFRLMKISYANGDKSMADTLEALTQVQSIRLLQSEAELNYQKSSIDISRFLWQEETLPYLISLDLIPDNNAFNLIRQPQNVQQLIATSNTNHPELLQYKYKLKGLEVEQKLARQSMLPTLDLKANLLSPNAYNFGAAYSPILSNNYKFGVDFKFPILMREGRGKFQKTTFKLIETNFGQKNKAWEIENKIRQADAELRLLNNQIEIASSLNNNYAALLRNENLKFNQGESSLFVINSRQSKLLDGQIKLQTLKIKYQQTFFKQLWAAGILAEN